MNAVREAFDAVRAMALASQTAYARVDVGALPAENGLCMAISAGVQERVTLDLRGDLALDVVLNAKHARQETALDALCAIHRALTTSTALPCGDDWQVLSIQTQGAPCYIGRDDAQWLYASGLSVRVSVD